MFGDGHFVLSCVKFDLHFNLKQKRSRGQYSGIGNLCLDIIICRSIISAIMRPSDVPYMPDPTNSVIKFNRLFLIRLNQRELVGGDVKSVDVGGEAGVGLLGTVGAVLG